MKMKSKLMAMLLVAATTVTSSAATSIVGDNRYDTAAKIAAEFTNYKTAILVNGDSIVDGLSASSLAGKEHAPILFTKKDSIPGVTLQKLKDVNQVYLIGGESVISHKVEKKLSNKKVIRIGGKDRTETSYKVAKELGAYSKAFVVKGEADAMSVAPVAARDKMPILVMKNNKFSPNPGVKYYSIGGNVNVPNSTRIYGENRYDTNVKVLEKFYRNTNKLYCASGENLVDALAVAPLARDSGLFLVDSKTNELVIDKVDDIVQVGGIHLKVVPSDKDTAVDDVSGDKNIDYLNSNKVKNEAKKEFYRLLQEERRAYKFNYVQPVWQLEETAYVKSKHMSDNKYFSHYPYVKTEHYTSVPSECIVRKGIKVNEVDRWTGKRIGKTLFDMWKSSPDHYRIMIKDTENPSEQVCGFDYHVTRGDNAYYYLHGTYHYGYKKYLK